MSKGRMKRKEGEQGTVSFRRLVFRSLPEVWSFQFFAGVTLTISMFLFKEAVGLIAGLGGSALTSADMRGLFLSWRGPVLLVLGVLMIMWLVVLEVMGQICMADDILSGHKTGVRRSLTRGFSSLKRFKSISGVLILLYIFIAVPLCGVGFSISISRNFYIPNFIFEVIASRTSLKIVYAAGIVLLLVLGFRSMFAVHGILLDGKTPKEARRSSIRIIKDHGWDLVKRMLVFFILSGLISLAAILLFRAIPDLLLEKRGADLPRQYTVGLFEKTGEEITELDSKVLSYRIASALTILMGGYLYSNVVLLLGSYLALKLTRLYREYTEGPRREYPDRPIRYSYLTKVFTLILVFILVFALSVTLGLFFDLFMADEPVRIVAHRAGGNMEAENSLEGLETAIEHGCYGSEIDVQRTADGYYIINHDTTFKRLAGVDRKPGDMTLEEIMELRLTDSTGAGRELKPVTIEEMLDVIKGREKLFIELKGVSADSRTVDDLVRIIREKDCVDDVAFISLNYDVINYAETNYPEFETGVLFYIGIGNVSRLNCDILLMEEEIATVTRVNMVHEAGKKAMVWTVNRETDLYRFLDRSVDGVITDEVVLAEKVQKDLDDRSDFRVMEDMLKDFWN